MINTVEEKRLAINDSRIIRTAALAERIPIYTTIWGGEAAAMSINNIDNNKSINVYDLQELHNLK